MVKKPAKIEFVILLISIVLWAVIYKTYTPFIMLAVIGIHEVGHIVSSLLFKNGFKRISFQTGGFILSGNKSFGSYRSEAVIALCGPLLNIIFYLLSAGSDAPLTKLFSDCSLAIAILNLLPVEGFDGGRLVSCILFGFLPHKASGVICDFFSFLALFFLWSVSVYLMLKTDRNISPFFFSASVFLKIIQKSPGERICEIIRE